MYLLQAINMNFYLIKKKNSNSLHTRKIADKNCPKNLYLYLCAHIGIEL